MCGCGQGYCRISHLRRRHIGGERHPGNGVRQDGIQHIAVGVVGERACRGTDITFHGVVIRGRRRPGTLVAGVPGADHLRRRPGAIRLFVLGDEFILQWYGEPHCGRGEGDRRPDDLCRREIGGDQHARRRRALDGHGDRRHGGHGRVGDIAHAEGERISARGAEIRHVGIGAGIGIGDGHSAQRALRDHRVDDRPVWIQRSQEAIGRGVGRHRQRAVVCGGRESRTVDGDSHRRRRGGSDRVDRCVAEGNGAHEEGRRQVSEGAVAVEGEHAFRGRRHQLGG